MDKTIKISGKVLAQLNMPDYCPRCFWVKQKVKDLPFQIFPGIFASIDAYSKRVVHAYFDINGVAPPWLPSLNGAVRHLKAPHWSKFSLLDPETGVTLSGAMDDLFECEDGTHIIPDYKTAKFTPAQDKLLPLYEGQLNSYRWIHEGLTGKTVRSLPLIYCEPVTDEKKCDNQIFRADGFVMGFTVNEIEIEIKDGLVIELLRKAAEIMGQVEPPQGRNDCKDCDSMDSLFNLLQNKIFKEAA